MSGYTHFIIAKGEYPGNAQTIYDARRDVVGYTSPPQTLAEYYQENGDQWQLVTPAELYAIDAAYEQTLVTAPQAISEREWWDLLEVLPPCKWGTVSGVELFHISEHLRGDLVTWCARIGSNHYCFTDQASADPLALAEKVSKANQERAA